MQVEGVSLTLQEGETLGFAGLEGSGQGLLMRAIAGLEPIHHGQMILNSEDVTQLPYQRRVGKGLAFMPAGRLEEGLVRNLNLTEHMVLSAPKKSFFINWQHARVRTDNQIDHFQVVGTHASPAEALSGGNQQRFLFAMLNSPLKVILLDQPTRGLDVRSTQWIWTELDLWREQGAAIIFISAELDEVVEHSDRVAVFSSGRLVKIVDAARTNATELGHLIGGGLQ
jgi:simple sugar transport system ATP-binding protein